MKSPTSSTEPWVTHKVVLHCFPICSEWLFRAEHRIKNHLHSLFSQGETPTQATYCSSSLSIHAPKILHSEKVPSIWRDLYLLQLIDKSTWRGTEALTDFIYMFVEMDLLLQWGQTFFYIFHLIFLKKSLRTHFLKKKKNPTGTEMDIAYFGINKALENTFFSQSAFQQSGFRGILLHWFFQDCE